MSKNQKRDDFMNINIYTDHVDVIINLKKKHLETFVRFLMCGFKNLEQQHKSIYFVLKASILFMVFWN